MPTGASAVIDVSGLDALIAELARQGFRTLGPVVRDGAVVTGDITSSADLPVGWSDRQTPGHYRIEEDAGPALFAWAVGPTSWKPEFFPPRETVWRATPGDDGFAVEEAPTATRPVALIGARPCDLAALDVLDRVLAGGAYPDPGYVGRRHDAVVVTVECGAPSANCFCTSWGTGPHADSGFDLALTELDPDGDHRFLVRAGSETGVALLERLPRRRATPADGDARTAVLDDAAARISRSLPVEGLAALLERNLEHPRWAEVADRCLACGNCTLGVSDLLLQRRPRHERPRRGGRAAADLGVVLRPRPLLHPRRWRCGPRRRRAIGSG